MAASKPKAAPGGKKSQAIEYKIKLRKDDEVKVIAGRDKGKTGRIISIDRKKGTIVVEGVSMIKRHTRPNPQQQIKGGIAERESAISASNVMVLTPGGVATRIGYRIEGSGPSARRTRVARKSGEPLDKKG